MNLRPILSFQSVWGHIILLIGSFVILFFISTLPVFNTHHVSALSWRNVTSRCVGGKFPFQALNNKNQRREESSAADTIRQQLRYRDPVELLPVSPPSSSPSSSSHTPSPPLMTSWRWNQLTSAQKWATRSAVSFWNSSDRQFVAVIVSNHRELLYFHFLSADVALTDTEMGTERGDLNLRGANKLTVLTAAEQRGR